jgi:ankyrin repeat protein
MNKLKTILIDALILFTVSTAFVVPVSIFFKKLKGKTAETDPMVTLIVQGKTDELKKLISEHNRPDMRDDQGRTALMRAAYANYQSAKQTRKTDDQRAPMVPILLDAGTPLDARDHDGWTALMWASWSGLTKTAEQLLSRNASLAPADKLGNTALMLAAERGHPEIVKMLLEDGADITAKNKNGLTALDFARKGITAHSKRKDDYLRVIGMLKSS